jgi:hypothetical protein
MVSATDVSADPPSPFRGYAKLSKATRLAVGACGAQHWRRPLRCVATDARYHSATILG